MSSVNPWDLDNISAKNKTWRDLGKEVKTSKPLAVSLWSLSHHFQSLFSFKIPKPLTHPLLETCLTEAMVPIGRLPWQEVAGGEECKNVWVGDMLFEGHYDTDSFTPHSPSADAGQQCN